MYSYFNGDKQTKDDICQSILSAIQIDGGRFLLQVQLSPDSIKSMKTWKPMWRELDNDMALLKISQALRAEGRKSQMPSDLTKRKRGALESFGYVEHDIDLDC